MLTLDSLLLLERVITEEVDFMLYVFLLNLGSGSSSKSQLGTSQGKF